MNPVVKALLSAPQIHFPSIDSTNSYLLNLPAPDYIDGITCTANIQTNGTGRGDRKWISPLGGLYMSIGLSPEISRNHWHLISFVMAVAAAKAIQKCFPDITPELKWPNDVLLNRRKVAGILLQSKIGNISRLVAGIGVNVTTRPELLPERLLFPACAINQESGYPASIRQLGDSLRTAFFQLYSDWQANPQSILHDWKGLSLMSDSFIIIRVGKDEFLGVFHQIANDGALQLKIDDKIMTFHSGDVISMIRTDQ